MTEHTENTIELRNIRSLSGFNFFIPDYQRGYRWSDSEAKRMLDDFKEFYERKKENGEFYCLQPIVVKKKTWEKEINGQETIINGYEVIDGQQRLTTLYIILKCLEKEGEIGEDTFKLYPIQYQTRIDGFNSQKFLEHICNASEEEAEAFIDFYHMKTVYKAVSNWFNNKGNEGYRNKIFHTLLDDVNNVRVIWYEVSDKENATSIDIFTRLNIGKIPLTNSELIKALLLRRRNFASATTDSEATMKQFQISIEWNQIEQKLQNDSFWYFLCRSSWPFSYQNRIEFLFDLMMGRGKDDEFYFTFNKFNNQLKDLSQGSSLESSIDSIWKEIKQVFQTLEEWYEDHTLYHLIGFLIEYGTKIYTPSKEESDKTPKEESPKKPPKTLMEASRKLSKSEFNELFIKGKIRDQLKGIREKGLSNLSYDNGEEIKKVLLLFNILTILQGGSDIRFPFNSYKKEKWDIEHISSQTDKQITVGEREKWREDVLEFFVGSTKEGDISDYLKKLQNDIENEKDPKNKELELIDQIRLLKSEEGKIEDDDFEKAFSSLSEYFKEDKLEEKDSISNLTLLDATTNRGYRNAFFPIKRKWIISNDRQGIFVPIATKNVFLKFYSRKGNNLMFWEKSDAEDYLNAIEQTINKYLDENKNAR